MTETQLRQKVADTINAWVGAVRGDSRHKEILDIYNSQKPLPRTYAVQVNDAYCATTASAAYIKAGIAVYTGTECSVPWWITNAQKLGIWVEDDSYRPGIGDAICYDWDDNGKGDCTGSADHIGIVTDINGNYMTVTEGNISGGKVGRRTIGINEKYIRGYICPPFAKIADEDDRPSSHPEKTVDEIALEVLAGKWGNGKDRREALEAAGYDYEAVQDKVKSMIAAYDPPAPPYYAEAQEWAKEQGISDGTNPDGLATRAQIWTMLKRYHDKFGGDDP